MENMLKLECEFCGRTSCILWFPQDFIHCPYCGKFKSFYNPLASLKRIDKLYLGSDFKVHLGKLTKYTGTSLSPVIPSGIIEIGDNALRETKITSVVIPRGVIKIGNDAFRETELESLSLPESVCMIGKKTFMNCSQLTQVSLPDKLEYIGSYAFSGSGLTSIIIPWTVKHIGVGAFSNCTKLSEIYFQGRKPQFLKDAFYGHEDQELMPVLKVKLCNLYSSGENSTNGYISGLFYNTPWERTILQTIDPCC